MQVYVNDKTVRLRSDRLIGSGGEADVYNIGNGKALKLYKPPNHPDFKGNPSEQIIAKERITEHQQKLPSFPSGLPSHTIIPEALAKGNSGLIVGYTMRFLEGAEVLLKYSERSFRQSGISNQTIIEIFRDLHGTVRGMHKSGLVIGDFNNLNILIIDTNAYIIDVDSCQFGKFLCRLYTERFVDPLLCDPKAKRPTLIRPHTEKSDWYAFSIMLMMSLLFVGPYGGIYRPKKKEKRLVHPERPLHRVTVFHSEVRYPKPAIHYGVLPDELLEHFKWVFEKDFREAFPIKLIENLRWTKCSSCGTEHARRMCPQCQLMAPVVKAITVKGNVTAERIFRTRGIIVFSDLQDQKLKWLYHENSEFVREDKNPVYKGDLMPNMRFRIRGSDTLIGQPGRLRTFSPGKSTPDVIPVDNFVTLPIFDANQNRRYWLQDGQLMKDGQLGPEFIGDVLSNQTLFWVGPRFGFGFYRAGKLSRAFVFNSERGGINDGVNIPPIRGQLIDSTCMFTKDRCWFLVSTQEGGKTINRCTIIKADGRVEATTEAEEGDGSWLSSLRGKCAVSNFLFAATDDGIERVDIDGDQIISTREFPDTEPFVDSGSHLFPERNGIYVVRRQEILLLKIST